MEIPAPVDIVVKERRVGAFNGRLELEKDGNVATFTQKAIRSALQKAIRRQDWPKAKQSVVLYAMLNKDSKGGLTWLFNRLVLIAKEDCATVTAAFKHSFELWTKHRDAKSILSIDDVLAVVYFMCTNGTSRLPSHMRARYGSVRVENPIKHIVDSLLTEARQDVTIWFNSN